MSHSYRKRSEGNTYHVTLRGNGRQIIFEDDTDKKRFLETLESALQRNNVSLFAWCLMENHVHLLLRAPIESVSRAMLALCTSYAKYFNRKYDRVGSLFQDRFGSVAIESDNQLLACLRYIHFNPLETGLPLSNQWSSYREYLGKPGIADTSFLKGMIGDTSEFKNLHKDKDVPAFGMPRHRLTEDEAKETAKGILGSINPYDLRSLARDKRDGYLSQMKSAGMSIRQIERITSIGRGIIAKA